MTRLDVSGRSGLDFSTNTLFTNDAVDGATHQLIVRVHGWSALPAVGVDSCGTYFRTVARVDGESNSVEKTARVVIAVTVDADGRKIITVRSSLLFVNGLRDDVEVHLQSRTMVGKTHLMKVGAGELSPLWGVTVSRQAHVARHRYSTRTAPSPFGHWACGLYSTVLRSLITN